MTSGRRHTVWLVAAVVWSACADDRQSSAPYEQVHAYFGPHGIVPDAVHCLDRPASDDARVTWCEVSIDGERLEMEIEVVSEHVAPRVRPRWPTLITAEVEQEIAQMLTDRGHSVHRVRCPGRLWVVRSPMQRRCAVELVGGRGLWWVGRFSGEGSAHRAEITPRAVEGEALP